MCQCELYPFEKPLHEIYKEEYCLSPIPSLAMHCTNINSVYGISPNIDTARKLQIVWGVNSCHTQDAKNKTEMARIACTIAKEKNIAKKVTNKVLIKEPLGSLNL